MTNPRKSRVTSSSSSYFYLYSTLRTFNLIGGKRTSYIYFFFLHISLLTMYRVYVRTHTHARARVNSKNNNVILDRNYSSLFLLTRIRPIWIFLKDLLFLSFWVILLSIIALRIIYVEQWSFQDIYNYIREIRKNSYLYHLSFQRKLFILV